jgi:hypothetical protein
VKKILFCLAALLLFLPSVQGVAGDFDGSHPLICAVIETHECGPDGNCVKGNAQEINVPQFFKLNFKDNLVSSNHAGGEVRKTAVQRMERAEGMLILQGVQNGRAWSATISEADGRFVLTASGDEEAFVVFGACTGGCE